MTETNLVEIVKREIQIDVLVNLTRRDGGVKPIRPSLLVSWYDVEISSGQCEKNRDFEAIVFEYEDVTGAGGGGLFAVEFQVKSEFVDYDFPFYIQHGKLYFSHSTHRSLKSVYRFKVSAKFRIVNKE